MLTERVDTKNEDIFLIKRIIDELEKDEGVLRKHAFSVWEENTKNKKRPEVATQKFRRELLNSVLAEDGEVLSGEVEISIDDWHRIAGKIFKLYGEFNGTGDKSDVKPYDPKKKNSWKGSIEDSLPNGDRD